MTAVHVLAVVGLFVATPRAVAALVVAHVLFLWGGMVLGLHRLLSHGSFETPQWLTNVFGLLGVLAFQGGPLHWAATHRAHHAFNDQVGDAHAASRGFWWSHIAWLAYHNPNGSSFRRNRRLIPDLMRNGFLRFIDRYQLAINIGVVVTAGLLAALTSTLDVFFLAFPVRIVLGWHLTWLINSYLHSAALFGRTAEDREPPLRNSLWVSILVFGEGWHHNHHKYPSSAKTGQLWWQIDPAFWFLCLLEYLGLARLKVSRHLKANM